MAGGIYCYLMGLGAVNGVFVGVVVAAVVTIDASRAGLNKGTK
jgi:hypothetical protein